jgi:hypothetical protein
MDMLPRVSSLLDANSGLVYGFVVLILGAAFMARFMQVRAHARDRGLTGDTRRRARLVVAVGFVSSTIAMALGAATLLRQDLREIAFSVGMILVFSSTLLIEYHERKLRTVPREQGISPPGSSSSWQRRPASGTLAVTAE